MRKRVIFYAGIFTLLIQTLFSDTRPCYAAEIGVGAYPAESEPYVLGSDKTQISFGALEQGSTALGQDIVLSNQGTADITLQWREADYHDSIAVDAPETDFLAPGESCIFTLEPNTSLEPGIYNAFILFGDKADAYFERGCLLYTSDAADEL